ncbi:hypothetical protein HID58_015396, partial [Brassica napus]
SQQLYMPSEKSSPTSETLQQKQERKGGGGGGSTVVKEVGLAPTEAVTPVAAYDKPSTLPLTNTHEEVASDTPTLPSSETEPEATTPFEVVASEATSPAAAFQSVIPTLPPAVAADATSLAAFQSAIIRTPPPAVASNATSPAAFQSAIHTPSHGSSPALVTFSSTSSDLVTENVEGAGYSRECLQVYANVRKSKSAMETIFKQLGIRLKNSSKHDFEIRSFVCYCLEPLRLLPKRFRIPTLLENEDGMRFCVQNACIIFCTASGASQMTVERTGSIELLVVDEAAQLKECESVAALQLQGLRHVVLIGDELQLPAMTCDYVYIYITKDGTEHRQMKH